MQSALDSLKEAVAKTHHSLSHSTVAGLMGDIMYFMLLNKIAQAQLTVRATNESTLALDHY